MISKRLCTSKHPTLFFWSDNVPDNSHHQEEISVVKEMKIAFRERSDVLIFPVKNNSQKYEGKKINTILT